MLIKSVFLPELSQKIKICQAESKKELLDELSSLTSSISESSYKAWSLDTFIVKINQVFDLAIDGNNNSQKINELKDILHAAVIKVNPLLAAENLYISDANNITLCKTSIKLIDCPTWQSPAESSDLMVNDINNYFKIVENARALDHEILTEQWDLFPNLHIAIRKFDKRSKVPLLYGHNPSSQRDIEYTVIATCIDNFQQLFNWVSRDQAALQIPNDKVLDSLYELSVKHNPFLHIQLKDLKKLQQDYKLKKEGSSEKPQVQETTNRKSLKSVPKKEIIVLEEALLREIFGQDEAIVAVSRAIKRAYNGFKRPRLPIGSFFFYGPTSTGKTEVARVIAKYLTKSPLGLIKIPCNTLQASHTMHTLIGSPPGYVGYEEKGLLEKGLETSKFKVILFDEIEKAHPKLFDLVLEMLEEGEILMSNGNRVDVSQCLILFTSNLGQDEANKALNKAGFVSPNGNEGLKEQTLKIEFNKIVKDKLKPEFLARLNGTFYFKPLSMEVLGKIAEITLKECLSLIKNKNIKISYGDTFIPQMLKTIQIKEKNIHARHIKNFIDLEVMTVLGNKLMEFTKGQEQSKIELKLDISEKTGIVII